MYLSREIEQSIKAWMREPEALIITGPRQAGKTTLLKHLAKAYEGRYYTFDDPDTHRLFTHPTLVPTDKPLFLDEVQLLPDAGKIFKWLIDERHAKLIITGSGAFHITTHIQAYLVGRSKHFTLLPLTFSEYLAWKNLALDLYERFHTALHAYLTQGTLPDEPLILQEHQAAYHDYLTYGGYPRIVLTDDPEKKHERLKELITTLLEHDIFRYFTIHDKLAFERLIRLLASLNTSILKTTSLPQSYQTIQRYLTILKENYLITLITPYHANLTTELRKAPKLYFLDTGIANSLAPQSLGQLNETYAARHLYPYTPQYWRTQAKAEVDFIINAKDTLIPIEVKTQGKPSRSFYSFLRAYKPRRALILTQNTYASTFFEETGTHILTYPVYYL